LAYQGRKLLRISNGAALDLIGSDHLDCQEFRGEPAAKAKTTVKTVALMVAQ
jgi:hypothetical protein